MDCGVFPSSASAAMHERFKFAGHTWNFSASGPWRHSNKSDEIAKNPSWECATKTHKSIWEYKLGFDSLEVKIDTFHAAVSLTHRVEAHEHHQRLFPRVKEMHAVHRLTTSIDSRPDFSRRGYLCTLDVDYLAYCSIKMGIFHTSFNRQNSFPQNAHVQLYIIQC